MLDLQLISLIIILLPLTSALIVGLMGKKLGKTGINSISMLAIGFAFVLSGLILYKIYLSTEKSFHFTLYTWAESGPYRFQVGLLIDPLTSLMMVMVTFISWMVHLYSIGYMQTDPGYHRFFSYISLFTFSMLILVMSDNCLQLFFGWEMVGLMSYLLIGFWFSKPTAIFANLKAFLINRLGDIGLLLGIAAILYGFKTLDYQTIFTEVDKVAQSGLSIPFSSYGSVPLLTFIGCALFWGAMAKSAQVPLHAWLPDSMEGPTPISALIHAATMVTAGVFMLARFSPLLEYTEFTLNSILTIGALTCGLMGLVAIVQNDIKRIIAYSTLSQLGYMMVAIGVSAYPVAIFHLTTHAFFKALLFLGAGSVILSLHHEQDIWKMGNLRKQMPITYITMLIASLALIGFPFFSGFYSKDLIIEAVHASRLTSAWLAYPIVLGSVYLTALYTFKLFFVVFHRKVPLNQKNLYNVQESGVVIWMPLLLLAIPSLLLGAFLIKPLFEGFLQNSFIIHTNHPAFFILQQQFEGALHMGIKGFQQISYWLGLAGILTAWVCYLQYPKLSAYCQRKLGFFYNILQNKYGFDSAYQCVAEFITKKLGVLCWRLGDQKLIDGMAVQGSTKLINRWAYTLRKIQTGYLYDYAFAMIIGLLALLFFVMFNCY